VRRLKCGFSVTSLVLLPVLALGGCDRRNPAGGEAELASLREEVRALSDSASARFRADAWQPAVHSGADLIAVGLRVDALRDILASAASQYLSDVRLHLRLDVVVRAGDEVRVRVGPVTALAGRWDLAVTVQRVDALLRAGSIDLTASDSNRIDLMIPVEVSDATGAALIDFKWDASTLASVACGDFAVREPFEGYVESRMYEMRGYVAVENERGRTVARPVLRDKIFVSPQPTAESWQRVRQILGEQDDIFNCGLALSPARVEEMLSGLLTEGFRFSLPESVLRPIALPSAVLDEVTVAGRRVSVAVVPEVPTVIGDRLWLRAAVRPSALDDASIRVGVQ
jgi:hypothetical protein